MLLIGTAETFSKLSLQMISNDIALYNFTSPRDNFGRKLQLLPPSINFPITSLEFDQWYANFILTNDIYFMELMNIMYSLYKGNNVYIAISKGDIYETLMESITKLIQVRYGYCAQYLNESDDLCLEDESEFSLSGLKTFDEDRERYIQLMNSYGLSLEGII